MNNTPKGLRLHIGIFGRVNVGKSSFLNMVLGQNYSIVSDIAGTTTDVVEKSMELLPIGPVTFFDTGGLDDKTALAAERVKKAEKVMRHADVAILITEPGIWGDFEESMVARFRFLKIPFITVVNKIDLAEPGPDFTEYVKGRSEYVIKVSSCDVGNRDKYLDMLKDAIRSVLKKSGAEPVPLISDLVPGGSIVVLVVPIDLQAPKGRLILPQVQTIREVLDSDAVAITVKEREYAEIYGIISKKPSLVVCDSQVVLKMVADTPRDVMCTTFSILFARYKGDLSVFAEGAMAIDRLKSGDKVLIAEACSHHAIEDDIGRVKIPRWLRQYSGENLDVDIVSGYDFPENIGEYSLIIHCGGCMFNRKEVIFRIMKAKEAGVPITNYGVAISKLQGVLDRVLEPFPSVLVRYRV